MSLGMYRFVAFHGGGSARNPKREMEPMIAMRCEITYAGRKGWQAADTPYIRTLHGERMVHGHTVAPVYHAVNVT